MKLTTHLHALAFTIILVAFSAVAPLSAQSNTETIAKNGLLLDLESGAILFEKNADEAFEPFSMSKLMTIYLALDQIKRGNNTLDEMVTVSDDAWKNWNNRGSTMFLKAGDQVTIADLLRGIIVLSGNDACVVLAEHIGGTEQGYVDWMNDKAAEIGLTGSVFRNTTGWEAEGHHMTARDLATLTRHLIEDFPDLYQIFAEKEFIYKNFVGNKNNRNPLLYRFDGADGLKTGSNNETGTFGLTGSAMRDGRRLILVLGGMDSASVRSRESQRLMQMGFSRYKNYPLFAAGETVDEADVWLGQKATVPLVITDGLMMTLTRRQRSGMKVILKHKSPIPAPIKAGQPMATLEITAPGMEPKLIELVAGTDVSQVNGFGRIGAALSYMVFGASIAEE